MSFLGHPLALWRVDSACAGVGWPRCPASVLWTMKTRTIPFAGKKLRQPTIFVNSGMSMLNEKILYRNNKKLFECQRRKPKVFSYYKTTPTRTSSTFPSVCQKRISNRTRLPHFDATHVK